MTWPFGENPEDPDTVVLGRMANIVVPFTLTGTGETIRIHMIMPESHARAITHMTDEQARSMGPFFEVIHQSMIEFIRLEG